MAPVRQVLRHWDAVFDKLEIGILVSLILLMVGLAFVQLFLRIFLHSGIIWGDVALRNLVLWLGLLGATVATRESRHITIDVLPRLLPKKTKKLLGIFIDFFSAFICFLLAYGGGKFVREEFLIKTITFLQIPGWIMSVIFPLAFSIITLHFCANGLAKVLSLRESTS